MFRSFTMGGITLGMVLACHPRSSARALGSEQAAGHGTARTGTEAAPAEGEPAEVTVPPARKGPAAASSAGSPAADCDPSSFARAWPGLRSRLQSGAEGVSQLIDEERGVFVLHNPGAFSVLSFFRDFQAASEGVTPLGPGYFSFSCERVVHAPVPKMSCDTETWTTEGCVHSEHPAFSVEHWYDLMLEYDVTWPTEPGAREQAQRADASIEYGVYVTAASMGFYFGRVGCVWRVLAIDSTTPCDA